jgi:hypothetical protein
MMPFDKAYTGNKAAILLKYLVFTCKNEQYHYWSCHIQARVLGSFAVMRRQAAFCALVEYHKSVLPQQKNRLPCLTAKFFQHLRFKIANFQSMARNTSMNKYTVLPDGKPVPPLCNFLRFSGQGQGWFFVTAR